MNINVDSRTVYQGMENQLPVQRLAQYVLFTVYDMVDAGTMFIWTDLLATVSDLHEQLDKINSNICLTRVTEQTHHCIEINGSKYQIVFNV